MTSAATAIELPGNHLHINRHDIPNANLELYIGWLSADGTERRVEGIIRDQSNGQTYTIVRHEGDTCVVRRWVPPYDLLVYSIDWDYIISHFNVPVTVLSAVPLDHRFPVDNMLVRRFDGADERIFAFDAALQQWRHIPDIATFQSLGFYWCDVTAADAAFFERMTVGPPYPRTTMFAWLAYPNCHNV